jgi:hypothetical protein
VALSIAGVIEPTLQAAEIKRLVSLTPVVVPTTDPFRNPEYSELFLSGLRSAIGEAT